MFHLIDFESVEKLIGKHRVSPKPNVTSWQSLDLGNVVYYINIYEQGNPNVDIYYDLQLKINLRKANAPSEGGQMLTVDYFNQKSE